MLSQVGKPNTPYLDPLRVLKTLPWSCRGPERPLTDRNIPREGLGEIVLVTLYESLRLRPFPSRLINPDDPPLVLSRTYRLSSRSLFTLLYPLPDRVSSVSSQRLSSLSTADGPSWWSRRGKGGGVTS